MTQHEEQTGETEVEPELEQAEARWRPDSQEEFGEEVLCAVLKVCQVSS